MSDDLVRTERTTHHRFAENGVYDRAAMRAILRAGFVCHLGVVVDDVAMVVPTVYGLDPAGGTLFVHGSVASRSLRGRSQTVCVTVTHVDGLVLARSVFEHGVNYRSVMVYAVPRVITDPDEKLVALQHLSEHVAPGQWDYARRPSRKELAATTLLAMPLDEVSVKVSSGPPDDGDGPDAALGLWAGELPLRATWGEPAPDPLLPAGIGVPDHIVQRAGTPFGQ
jgi:nitroimidazol reductase NimA-like FMN-containing flavoprotein (pyridoxamine 5'-phosphate oxidase superfamily)